MSYTFFSCYCLDFIIPNSVDGSVFCLVFVMPAFTISKSVCAFVGRRERDGISGSPGRPPTYYIVEDDPELLIFLSLPHKR